MYLITHRWHTLVQEALVCKYEYVSYAKKMPCYVLLWTLVTWTRLHNTYWLQWHMPWFLWIQRWLSMLRIYSLVPRPFIKTNSLGTRICSEQQSTRKCCDWLHTSSCCVEAIIYKEILQSIGTLQKPYLQQEVNIKTMVSIHENYPLTMFLPVIFFKQSSIWRCLGIVYYTYSRLGPRPPLFRGKNGGGLGTRLVLWWPHIYTLVTMHTQLDIQVQIDDVQTFITSETLSWTCIKWKSSLHLPNLSWQSVNLY